MKTAGNGKVYIALGIWAIISLVALLACTPPPAVTPARTEPISVPAAATSAVATSVAIAPAAQTPAAAPTSAPSAVPTPRPTAVSTPAPTPTPAGPKTVRVGMGQEPDTISGYPGGMYAAAVVQNLIFNVLVGVDDKMQPYPDLVESIPTLENGGARWVGEGPNRQLQTTFKLRRGIKWSNGNQLTSRDVRFTWELMMNPESGAANDLERKYEKVETPDDYTVVFTLMSENSAKAAYAKDRENYADMKDQKGPVTDPLYSFGINGSWIYPEHVVAPLVENQPRTSRKIQDLFNRSDFAKNPVGTGPYILKEWSHGASLTLTARADYFKGRPKVEVFAFSFDPKSQNLIDRFRAGQLDVITQDGLSVSDAASLDALSGARPFYTNGVVWEHLDFNLDHPIAKDKNVRKAIYQAINRQEIIEKVFVGKGGALDNVLPAWSWAYSGDVPKYPYDPEKAKQMLSAAGWQPGPDGVRVKDGQRLSLKYISTDWPVRTQVSALLKAQLAKVGVDLAVEHISSKSMLTIRTGRMAQRSFEVAQYAWVSGYDPGVDAQYFYSSGSVPGQDNGFYGGNYPGYKNPEADRLVAAGLATLDQAERKGIYRDLQRLLMDDLPTLPLFYVPNVSIASDRVVNFKPGIAAIGETWNAAEWDLTQ